MTALSYLFDFVAGHAFGHLLSCLVWVVSPRGRAALRAVAHAAFGVRLGERDTRRLTGRPVGARLPRS